MHSRIQLDVTAQLSVRECGNGRYEIVAFDPHGESTVGMELFPEQAQAILDGLAGLAAKAEAVRAEAAKSGNEA